MLAPRRLDTPVDRPLLGKRNVTTNNETSEKGREGLVAGNGRPGGHLEEMLKDINGTTNSSGQEQPPSTLDTLDTLATPTISQEQPPSMTRYTVAIQASPTASSRPEGDAKADIESLPGQNQNKPELDNAVLPGINQDAPNMGGTLTSTMPAAAANAPPTPARPTITLNKPLPGQNQIMPSVAPGSLALGSTPPGLPGLSGSPGSPASPSPAPPPPPMMTTSSNSLSSIPTLATTITLGSSSTKSTSPTSVFASSSSLILSPITSFITITRSELDKENIPAGTLSSTQSSSTVSATTTATAQAIAAAQSFSVFLSSTGVIAAATSTSIIAADAQDGSSLHPTTRTLLIVFVILGVLSILVALIVIIMVRSHRKYQAQQQSMRSQNPYDASSDRIGITTHISANPNDNPFLTASEKAIVNRAASPDGASEVQDSSRFSDAVDSFVKKSRSLAYKISP